MANLPIMPAVQQMPSAPSSTDAAARLRLAAACALAAVAVVAALAFWTGFEEYTHAPKVMVIQMGVAIAVLLWVWSLRYDPVPLLVPLPFVPMGLLLVWAVSSALWTTDAPLALDTATHWAVAALAGLLAAQLLNSPAELRLILWGLTIAAVGVTAIGILQTWDLLALIPQAAPPSATFGNRNLAAEAVVFLLPASLLHLALARSWPALGIGGAALAGSLTFLVFARSRASWLAASAELLVCLVLVWRHRRGLSALLPTRTRWVAAAALATAVLLVAGRGGGNAVGRILDEKVIGRSRIAISDIRESGFVGLARSEARPVLFLHALHLTASHPVRGVGLAGFGACFPGSRLAENQHPGTYLNVFTSHYANAHNDWLQLACELGLVGFGLLFVSLWLAWRVVATALRTDAPPERRVIGISAFTLGVGAAVNASFAFPFYCAYPSYVVALLAGAAFADTDRAAEPPFRMSRLRWPVLLAFMLMVAGILAWRNALLAAKETHLGRMLDAAGVSDHTSVIQFGEAARRTPFSNQLALSYLGRAYDEVGDVPRALACANEFLAQEPFSANQRFFRAHCLARSGRIDEAIAEADLAARLARATPRAQLNAAQLMESCGASDAALDVLLALRNRDATYDLDYGLAAFRSGRREIAVTALRRAAQHPAHRIRRSEILQLIE